MGILQSSFNGGTITEPKFTSKYPWVSPNTLWTLLRDTEDGECVSHWTRLSLGWSLLFTSYSTHSHWTAMENWEAREEIRQKWVLMADKQRLFGLQMTFKCLKSIYILLQKSKSLSRSSKGLTQLLMKLLGFVPLTWSWPWAEPTTPWEFLSRNTSHYLKGTPPSCSPPP